MVVIVDVERKFKNQQEVDEFITTYLGVLDTMKHLGLLCPVEHSEWYRFLFKGRYRIGC